MTLELSPVVIASSRGNGDFAVSSIEMAGLGNPASPILVLDDFRVRGRPFGPHPHAGFAAVTYVFEDSAASLRSRDSLGHDWVVGPGGIVWSHAGAGMLHEELPADLRHELHGLQLFVNLSSKFNLSQPHVLQLPASEAPVWRSEMGDRIRVVVGSYASRSSPLMPAEPFNLLDVELVHELQLFAPRNHHTVIYARAGSFVIRTEGSSRAVMAEQAIGIQSNTAGYVTLSAVEPSRLLVLSAINISEPIVSKGPFTMNDDRQIEAAFARYRSGAMGSLDPAP